MCGSFPVRTTLMLLLTIGMLAGCAELPVSARAPYAAAPRASSVACHPPPGAPGPRPRALSDIPVAMAVDPDATYGLADLIDFAHRTNPETKRMWLEARAAAAQAARAEAAYYPTLFFMAVRGTSGIADPATPPIGPFTITRAGVKPQLHHDWLLSGF